MTLLLRLHQMIGWGFMALLPLSAAAEPNNDIEFGFNNKPPMFFFEGTQARGEVVDVVRQACSAAAVRCKFTELPFQRVLVYLEQGRPGFAALGFSKTPDREEFVTFSEPVWRDSPPVLLVRAGDKNAFLSHASLKSMIQNSQFVFGGKLGNVYPISDALQGLGARDTRFAGEANRFPLLLVGERFDFTMLYKDEILPALQASKIAPEAVATISYPDLPLGGERFLLFSKNVPTEIVRKLNVALRDMRKAGRIKTLR